MVSSILPFDQWNLGQMNNPPVPNSEKKNKVQTKKTKPKKSADVYERGPEKSLSLAVRYRNYRTQMKKGKDKNLKRRNNAGVKVEIGPSHIHRFGLFATEDFYPGNIVIEYVGEIISNPVADKREKEYEEQGIGDCYLFRLDDDFVIDATR